MKRSIRHRAVGLALLTTVCNAPGAIAEPRTASFSYQGHLKQSGAPAQGAFDFRFSVYDASTGGNPVGPLHSVEDTLVDRGLFDVTLDFGNAILGPEALWLEVQVREGASTGSYTTLAPRQPLQLFARNGAQAPLDQALTGTVTVGPGSQVVIGTGTLFTSELEVGNAIGIAGVASTVIDIISDTQIDLAAPHPTGAFGAPAFSDSTLFSVQTGAGTAQLSVGREGMKVGEHGSTITRIDHGTIGTCDGVTLTSPGGTQMFDQPFPSPPRVFLTAKRRDGITCMVAFLDSVTNQHFGWSGFNSVFGGQGCDCIHWIALGS